MGIFSIKSVLPALFLNGLQLDYHALEDMCQNGGDAMNLFHKLKDMSPEDETKAGQASLIIADWTLSQWPRCWKNCMTLLCDNISNLLTDNGTG